MSAIGKFHGKKQTEQVLQFIGLGRRRGVAIMTEGPGPLFYIFLEFKEHSLLTGIENHIDHHQLCYAD